jgi:hypothetical protein
MVLSFYFDIQNLDERDNSRYVYIHLHCHKQKEKK